MSFCSILSINKLQFSLKNLQEKENYEIGKNVDYSSIDENDFADFTDYHFWDQSYKIDPRPIFTPSPSKKFIDYLESISLERGDSFFPFKGGNSSSCVTKGSTSSVRGSIDASVASEEETFKTFCPNDDHNFHYILEPTLETSFIAVFDRGSSCHRDPSWREAKESEAKAHDSISIET